MAIFNSYVSSPEGTLLVITHGKLDNPLLLGLEHLDYFLTYIGNVIIPTDELTFFRGVETTNQ